MVSEILDESYEILKDHFGNNPPEIKSIIRGDKFVAVQLSDMSIGLSFIEHEWPQHFPLYYQNKTIDESIQTYVLGKMACIGEGMEVSYGIATLNALTSSIFLNTDKYDYLEDILLLELWRVHLTEGTSVGMVGNMYPLVEILLEMNCKVIILDKHAQDPNKEPLPKEVKLIENSEDLDQIDILIATGSSLVYHSTEELIYNAKNAKLKAIIGPTVTLPPEPFWDRGVNYIGGSIVTTKYLQTVVAEELRDPKRYKHQKEIKGALKFNKNTGLKKIGLFKN